ncbi:ML domain-containing protein [Sergentomyia squamirostris]
MFKFLLFTTLIPAAVFGKFNIKPCSGINLPTNFDIRECPNGSPCDFKVGEKITLDISFKTDKKVDSIPTVAEITRSNGEVQNFPLPSGDACNAIAGGCPLGPGEHTVRFPVVIGGIPADEPVSIAVTMRDQNKAGLACGSIDAKFHPTN